VIAITTVAGNPAADLLQISSGRYLIQLGVAVPVSGAELFDSPSEYPRRPQAEAIAGVAENATGIAIVSISPSKGCWTGSPDDLGAHVAENLRRHRPQYRRGQIDDANARKRTRHAVLLWLKRWRLDPPRQAPHAAKE
jgi:hypothetical protein